MADSLEALIEKWEQRAEINWHNSTETDKARYYAIYSCISDLRDTMIVMEAEKVRKEKP